MNDRPVFFINEVGGSVVDPPNNFFWEGTVTLASWDRFLASPDALTLIINSCE